MTADAAARGESPLDGEVRWAHTYDPAANFLVVKFWGAVTYADELAAVGQLLGGGVVARDPRILADRTESTVASTPEEVREAVAEVGAAMPADIGTPQVAVVVGNEADFGLLRMFQISAEGTLRHDFCVFRNDLEEAARWLGLDLAQIALPRRRRQTD